MTDGLPPPPPETMRQRIGYWQYRAAWDAVSFLPDRVAFPLADRAGDIWFRRASARQRALVRRHLTLITGSTDETTLEALVRAAYRSYARYWIDSFRVHRMDAERVHSKTVDGGRSSVDDLRDSGLGGIMVTGHIGSWDAAALYAKHVGWRLAVVAEVVEPRRLFDRFVAMRRHIGLEVFPLVRGGDMVDKLEGFIAGGGIATLLADRDLTKKGPIVDFFGEPCRLPPGPAVLARRTGRPVVAAAVAATPTGWYVYARDPVDIADLSIDEGTQVVAHELEALIRRFPEQWHVFVPNWLADREPEPGAVAAPDG